MKKLQILMTMALLAMTGNALADELRVDDFTIEPGETKTISVKLNNPNQTYIAFEFFMTLPEGISVAEDEDGYLNVVLNSARSSRHTLEAEQNADGSYHFLCYSNRNNAFNGTEGEILSMTITADESLGEGVLQGLLFAQKLSDPNENKVVFNDFTFNITVANPAPTSVTINIPDGGATTYCPSYDLDFSGVTGFKAYVATRYNNTNNTVFMQQADDAPKGIGLYLKGTPGEYTVPVKSTDNSYTDMLAGTVTGTNIPATDGSFTNLTVTSSGKTFAAATDGEAMDANTAWLQLPTANYNGQIVGIEFKEETLDGDLNNDGSISLFDIMMLVEIILNQ